MFEAFHRPHHLKIVRLAPALIALENTLVVHSTARFKARMQLLTKNNHIQKSQVNALPSQRMNGVGSITNEDNSISEVLGCMTLPQGHSKSLVRALNATELGFKSAL